MRALNVLVALSLVTVGAALATILGSAGETAEVESVGDTAPRGAAPSEEVEEAPGALAPAPSAEDEAASAVDPAPNRAPSAVERLQNDLDWALTALAPTLLAVQRASPFGQSLGGAAPRGVDWRAASPPSMPLDPSEMDWTPRARSPIAAAVRRRAPVAAVLRAFDPPDDAVFSNTYYDFPVEQGGVADTPLYTSSCQMISMVPASFHDRLCVQGSGRLASGDTVSFSGRDCACAAVCPRTGQRICYESLDRERFPCGRGSTGRAISPLRTVAVDPTVVPMGALLYIPELKGFPMGDGTAHDGCFVAEDRGLKIKGHRIDIFAGDEGTRRLWDVSYPSHRGVHVYNGSSRCSREAMKPRRGCDVRHP